MCLKVVPCLVKICIRINHDWRSVVGGVENVEIAVSICLEQNANPITLLKNPRRLSANCQTGCIAHEKCQTKTQSLSVYWCRLSAVGLCALVIRLCVL